jgi:hypothetical protein
MLRSCLPRAPLRLAAAMSSRNAAAAAAAAAPASPKPLLRGVVCDMDGAGALLARAAASRLARVQARAQRCQAAHAPFLAPLRAWLHTRQLRAACARARRHAGGERA